MYGTLIAEDKTPSSSMGLIIFILFFSFQSTQKISSVNVLQYKIFQADLYIAISLIIYRRY